MNDELEVGMTDPVLDVALPAGEVVVGDDHLLKIYCYYLLLLLEFIVIIYCYCYFLLLLLLLLLLIILFKLNITHPKNIIQFLSLKRTILIILISWTIVHSTISAEIKNRFLKKKNWSK